MAKAAAVTIGTIVTHAKFGSGKVVAVDGDKLSIAFADTTRTLLARFVTWRAPVVEKPTAQQLLEQILANPDDDAPRLAYADLLQEAGDPRGEFIVMQCAGLAADELLARHAADWTRAFDPRGRYRFARGFVWHAELAKPKHAVSLLAREPVDVIEIPVDEVGGLLALDGLERLRALRLAYYAWSANWNLRWLVESPRLTKLEMLVLAAATRHDHDRRRIWFGLDPLAQWKHERLATLGLLDLYVTADTARALAAIDAPTLALVAIDDTHWEDSAFAIALERWSSTALAIPSHSRRIPELARRGYTETPPPPAFVRAFERMGWQERTVWTR